MKSARKNYIILLYKGYFSGRSIADSHFVKLIIGHIVGMVLGDSTDRIWPVIRANEVVTAVSCLTSVHPPAPVTRLFTSAEYQLCRI